MARPRRPGRGRPEARLDPIRWRRPGRGALIRLAAIAALLVTAALISWSGPETCASPAGQAGRAATATSSGSATRPDETTAQRGSDAVDSSEREEGSGTQAAGADGRAAVPTGTVGVPVRLAEPTALTLVRPGDHVDLLRVADDSHDTSAVAASALVLGVTGADDPTTGGLLLALTPAEAAKAVAQPGGGFAVLIRP
jgi:hypothetical protein